MWKNSLISAALLLVTYLGAETPKFNLNAPWKAVGEGEFAIAYPGQGWAVATGSVNGAEGKLYQIEFEAKVKPGNPMLLQINDGRDRRINLDGNGEWNRYRIFCFGGASGQLRLGFYFNPGAPTEAAVRNVRVTEAAISGNLLSDGDFEGGNSFPVDWSRSGNIFPAGLAPSTDFLAGEKCMVIPYAADADSGICSHSLPLEVGKTLKLSFWARSSADREMTAVIDCYGHYGHSGKHLYTQKRFKVGSGWKQYSLSLQLPENTNEVPDLADRLFRVHLRAERNAGGGELRIEDVEVLCE